METNTLVEIKTKINEEVVEMAENILARAKSGEIQSLVAVGLTDDGCCFNQFCGGGYSMAMLGEIRWV